METIFDYIKNLILNTWFGAIIVIIVIVIIYMAKLKKSIKEISPSFKCKKEFAIELAGEKITFDVKLRSYNYDVVKINAITHILGIQAERAWINKYYPGYKIMVQTLERMTLDNGKLLSFDRLSIHKGNKKKDIYFDITDFIDGASVSLTENTHEYAHQKIKEIYTK